MSPTFTVESCAREVLAAIDTTAGHLLCAQWVARRYQRIASKGRLRHLRRVGEIVVPATMAAGTVAVTQGSNIITPDATAAASWATPTGFPADPLNPALSLIGRFIRPSINWYEITDVVGSPISSIRTRTPYVEDTNATAAYAIVEQRTRLLPETRWLGDFVHMRRRIPLTNMSIAELDHDEPERMQTMSGDGPTVWAETTVDTDGVKRVEFYPYPTQNELIRYVFWSIPPELGFSDPIPPQVDPHVLIEGALIDAMRYEAAKAIRAGQADMAGYWTNSYRAQSTAWEKQIIEAIRSDLAVDDVTMILQLPRNSVVRRGDISTAHDIVLERWPL